MWQCGGGMHGRGGCVWQGVCMAGDMCGRGPPGRYYEIWSMSGQYASYWNAFQLLIKFKKKQECIPVGCVPSTAVAIGGVSTGHPQDQTPLEQAPPPPRAGTPPGTRHPTGAGTPWSRHSPGSRHPPMSRHTPVNILPCPKLRLRAVKIRDSQKFKL